MAIRSIERPQRHTNVGCRHYCDGTAATSSLSAVSRRSVNALAVGQVKSTCTDSTHTSPAPITKTLLADSALTPHGLIEFDGYNEVQVHNTSQLFLQQMMYYHMDATTRDKFLNISKPPVGDDPGKLPDALADQLDPTLKAWLADTYAPAYISVTISQNNLSTALTPAVADKIWYWWSGCVS